MPGLRREPLRWDLIARTSAHAGYRRTADARAAWNIHEDEYISGIGKGYIDALADAGLEADRSIGFTSCPWCETPFDEASRFCPRCGRQLGAIRLYRELVDRGVEEREARAMLVRAGYDPF